MSIRSKERKILSNGFMIVIAIVLAALLSVSLSKVAYGATVASFEAETMRQTSGKGWVFRDSMASGNKGWVYATKGKAYRELATPAVDRVAIRARGDRCEGAPIMRLKIDGVQRASWTVKERRWTRYSASIEPLRSGTHKVLIEFPNDKRSEQCDRNLRLDKVNLIAASTQTQPAPEEPSRYDNKPDCEGSLQHLIDAAAAGDVVVAPGECVYREEVKVTKPITLEAAPGAEIRGSEVWSRWSKSGVYWIGDPVPAFSAGDVRCEVNTNRCKWPEQVFFDGRPLNQVASDPQSGQFALDADRRVVLADDPAGHTVEVTTREQWIIGRADHVTIRGFTMRHAANSRSLGAITNQDDRGGYHPYWTIENNALSDVHTAVVRVDGRNTRLMYNDISRGGQFGIQGDGENILVRGNKIHHNNTEDFQRNWAAGGAKFAPGATNLTVDDNEVFNNNGSGIWTDIGSLEVVYSNNRVHHNAGPGLHFEVSSGAQIFGNVVWENGWGDYKARPWSPGISVVGSRDVEVYNNTLAWNAAGLSVIHMKRSDSANNTVKNVYVHDNVILAEDGPSLYWIQDDKWDGEMTIDDPAANNRGSGNDYWYPTSEDARVYHSRFRWATARIHGLAEFNATPGEENGSYMSPAQKDAVVTNKSIPSRAEDH